MKDRIQDSCRIQGRNIAHELHISIGTARNIVYEQLSYRKRCSRWVPRDLREEHKATRMVFSLQNLMRFQAEGVPFLNRIVTGDETWVHHVTHETKRETMAWKHPSSPPCKKFKTTRFIKKVMGKVFWDHQDALLVEIPSPVERPWMLPVILSRWIGRARHLAGNYQDYPRKVSCCCTTTTVRTRLQ